MTRITKMSRVAGFAGAFLLAAAPGAVFAQSAQAQDQAAQQEQPQKPAKHHSKLKGAVVGGAGGAVVGGKKGAAVGAGAGALYQHHKNKKAEKEQQKQQ